VASGAKFSIWDHYHRWLQKTGHGDRRRFIASKVDVNRFLPLS